MSKMKKWIILGLVVLCSMLTITLVLTQCVSITGEPWMAGGAVCISFDKWDMVRADKVVISFCGETYTITEPEFVREFSRTQALIKRISDIGKPHN